MCEQSVTLFVLLSFTRKCVETPIKGSESQRPAISSRRGEIEFQKDCMGAIYIYILLENV